ncbi:MAG: NAD-dependent epimerase/dehydratase family protein [Nitrospiraceae bacterium]|nr:NAD-dependent epimerase/dehydratase family protein [Nitrospiraceae bacterium]
MKVLVTGGCGFLGSHVCEFYIKRGAEVISYDNMTKHELERTEFAAEAARNYNWDYLKKIGVSLIKADIRNHQELLGNAQGCDYIVHTAAQPAMTISWEDPHLDLSTNVIGTFNVLETARKLKVPVASCATVHVYGNRINETLKEGSRRYIREPEGIDEGHPILEGTLTPLHASKSAADFYVKTYADTYGVEAASFRLTGIYGARQFGGEDHGWVANFSIRSVLGRPITIFGSGKQVRDIIYATDVCEAFDAFYKARRPGIYNIGGGPATATSLIECIDMLEKINGGRPDVRFAADRHGDLRYFICDISKAKTRLGWSPKVMPEEGISSLVGWIRENRPFFIGDDK